MQTITEFAPAKVNLYLSVVGRREDGYHLIDSLFAFAAVGDRLSVRPADDLTLEIAGPQGAGLRADGAENLVLKAARALRAATGCGQGAALVLDKQLPVASGIGGGSADAAAALRALDALWGLGLGLDDLARIGAAVGADVPAAVHSVPLRVGGIGERLEPTGALPPFGLLLVNPGLPLSTVAVFRRLREMGTPFALPLAALPEEADALLRVLGDTPNMLEAPAMALEPVIATVLSALAALPGCRLARMSGSGATCFALFDSPEAARRAAAALPPRPGWWVWSGGFHDAKRSL